MDDKHWSVRAKLLSLFFDVATAEIFDANCAMVCINQVRQNMDPKTVKYFPYYLPGGESKNHAMSIQMMLSRPLDLMAGKQQVGKIYRGTTTKNKTFPDKQKFEMHVRTDGGVAFDTLSEVLDMAKLMGLITNKDGDKWVNGWAYYGGEKLGNGREQVYNYIGEHQEIADEWEEAIDAKIAEANETKEILNPVDADVIEGIGG